MRHLGLVFIFLCTMLISASFEPLDPLYDVTYYNLTGKTATGDYTTAIEEPFVAVSRDLLELYPLNTHILLYGCDYEGVYKVMDKMGKRHKKAIDVFTMDRPRPKMQCYCKALR